MYLYFSKNSRTFDVRYPLEQSNSNLLNLNKAQATCESQDYSSVLRRVTQRPEPILKTKKMRNLKRTTTQTIPAIDYRGHRLIKTVHYDSNGFGLQIEFDDGRESLTLWCNNEALDRQLPVDEQCITCRNKALYDDFFC